MPEIGDSIPKKTKIVKGDDALRYSSDFRIEMQTKPTGSIGAKRSQIYIEREAHRQRRYELNSKIDLLIEFSNFVRQVHSLALHPFPNLLAKIQEEQNVNPKDFDPEEE